MPRFAKTMTTVAAGAATAIAIIGVTAGPAFAKSSTSLSGPRTAQAGHGFRLTVAVGDDGGAKPASARLQLRDGHGHFHWYGPWQRLHRTDHFYESCAFTVTGRHRGPETFRAVVTGYATTSPVTVVVR